MRAGSAPAQKPMWEMRMMEVEERQKESENKVESLSELLAKEQANSEYVVHRWQSVC